jgi:glycine oxidase
MPAQGEVSGANPHRASTEKMRMPDVLVIGGGVIGLGVAWRCAQRGLKVTVVDPAPGSGASSAAAGMLAPATELHYGEQALLQLNLDSARRYPQFAAELVAASGHDIGYRRSGALVAAWDDADLANLRDLQAFGSSLGVATELLTGREIRRREPALASAVAGGLYAPDDHAVDNRRLHAALLEAVRVSGGELRRERVVALEKSAARVSGIRTDLGHAISADTVVLAAGAWSAQLPDPGGGALPPIRPVKGQTVRLRVPGPPLLRHVIRGTIKGSPVYLVPRDDGELVVGASSEEVGFDLAPRAGAVYELLRDAQSLIPLLGEVQFGEVSTSVRPGSPDNAPIIGRSSIPGLVLATGHYRNGILLTPVTADGIADLISTGSVPDALAGFSVDRFLPRMVTT